MDKETVDLINKLSEIYASIRERVVNEGELLESDTIFIDFYKKFVDKAFSLNKYKQWQETALKDTKK